jgi:hypothetical protein
MTVGGAAAGITSPAIGSAPPHAQTSMSITKHGTSVFLFIRAIGLQPTMEQVPIPPRRRAALARSGAWSS